MAAVTIGLSYLDSAWSGYSQGYGDAYTVGTAQGLAALINGPGAPGVMNLRGQLLGVAIFWTWNGFLIDRRFRGVRSPLIRRVWIRFALYLLGLGLASWSFWSVAKYLLYEDTLKYLARMPSIFLSNSPIRFGLGRDLMAIARLIWGFGYALYFLKKLLWLEIGRSRAATVR